MKKIFAGLILSLFIFVVSFAKGNSVLPVLSVSVENSYFSPIAKNKEGIIFISAISEPVKIKFWVLSIFDESFNIVKVYTGKKSIPEKIIWNALDKEGNPVADGKYSYRLFVKTNKGDLIHNAGGLIIDTIAPYVSIKPSNEVYFYDSHTNKLSGKINLYLSFGDETGIDFQNSFVKIFTLRGKEVKSFSFDGNIPELISWDGIDDIYNIILPVGNYKILFSVADVAGNSSSVKTEISVVALPKEQPDENSEIKE